MFEDVPRSLTLAELEAFDPDAPGSDGERRFCCPLPGVCTGKPVDAKHRSLSLNVATGEWYCFRCQAGGQVRERWQDRPRGRRERNLAVARQAFGLTAPRVQAPKAPATATTWTDAWAATEPLGEETAGARYLTARGIPLVLASAAGVRWAPRWYGRPAVVFPITNQAGETIAASGRYTDGGTKPKARTGGPKSLGLFVTPGALRAEPLIVTEAPIDALALAACGVPAVALVGVSGPHWLADVGALRAVRLATDADQAGDEAAAALTTLLQPFGARCERLRPTAKDWADDLSEMGCEALGTQLAMRLGRAQPADAAFDAMPCWWSDAPWYGAITQEDFDSVIDAYIARFGHYTPAMPLREPDVLNAWCAKHGLSRL